MSNFYHVTDINHWQQIKTTGQLTPQIGPRSQKLGEIKPHIYGFPTIEDASDGVMQWLGDEFDEDLDLILLCITIPKNEMVSEAFELQVNHNIPITAIDKVISPF